MLSPHHHILGDAHGQHEGATFAFCVGAVITALLVNGCGPKSDRLSVTGEVSLDGTPLEDGSIRFTSQDGQKMVASGAMIQHGEYRISQEKGLPPGTYRVEITAADKTSQPRMYRPAPGEPAMLTMPERIPPAYNVNSTQTVEVRPDQENHFVFDIRSRPAK